MIGQLRKKYKILHVLPISLIKCPSDSKKDTCIFDRILIVTAALTNLSYTIVLNHNLFIHNYNYNYLK